jgi:spermidine synthase
MAGVGRRIIVNKSKQSLTESDSGELSAGLRRFLYLTATITGAVILIVEILGAKMLSPFLGTSHFVWTAQIAVTLVALSVGYFVGGYVVDRSPRLNFLYYSILGAAVYLVATVPMVRPICFKLLKLPLEWASLFASAFLFLIPLALLAMTGPFLVRVLTQNVKKVGGSMGRLTAISTLGSVAGAVLIGYVLIPNFRNSVTMLITAGVLVALVAIYFIVWGRNESSVTVLVVAGLLTAGLGHSGLRGQFADTMKYGGLTWDVLYRANSNYGELLVIEHRDSSGAKRRYLNDQLIQNTFDPETGQSRSLFTGALRWLAHAYSPQIENALCIGMGVGIVPMQLARDDIAVDVAEINGAVVPIAEQFFGFDSSKVNVTISDGRQYLNQTSKQYDAIILDAFLGDSSPSHLMTKEAFTSIRDHLSPEGVLVINSFGESNSQREFFAASLDQTLRLVFGDTRVRVHASGHGNVFFVATRAERLVAYHPPKPPNSDAERRMALLEARAVPFRPYSYNKLKFLIQNVNAQKNGITAQMNSSEIAAQEKKRAEIQELDRQKSKWQKLAGELGELDKEIYWEWQEWVRYAEKAGEKVEFYSEHPDDGALGQMGLMWYKRRTYNHKEGQLLKDDFNPVDFHDAHNREANRRELMKILQPKDG